MQQLECTAILFDLDGVLIDSTACITRHWQDWARQHGLDIAAIMQVAHGRRTIETMRIVAPHLALDEEVRQFEAGEVVDTEGIITIDGALALLDSIPRWCLGHRHVRFAPLGHCPAAKSWSARAAHDGDGRRCRQRQAAS